jgi:hypothetical protein
MGHGHVQATHALRYTFSAPTQVSVDGPYRPAVSVRRASDDPAGWSGPVHSESQAAPAFDRYMYRSAIRAFEGLLRPRCPPRCPPSARRRSGSLPVRPEQLQSASGGALARMARSPWRILSAVYVRHDGLSLHSTSLTPFSTSALIREVIHEAERKCREAAS